MDVFHDVELSPGEVHVWRVALEPESIRLAIFEATLTEAERVRAHRFRTAELRRGFVAGRGALRAILGCYMAAHPSSVEFEYGKHGKPRLAPAQGVGGLEFNLAHSGERALCAVARGRAVGVDVERVRTYEEPGKIVGRYFSAAEQAEFRTFPVSEQAAAFLRGWTRKEAFLKATGQGLARALDSFEVSLARVPARLLRVGDDPSTAGLWTLCDVDAGPGYLGALVVEGTGARVLVRDWLIVDV